LDLDKAKIGENTFVITPENISLPPGVYLKKIEQPTVSVTLDVPMKKELPIQISWVGALSEDLILAEATLYPGKVQVFGGSRILKNVSTIYTEPVHLENIKASGKLNVNLLFNPPSLKNAASTKDRVTVTYVVKKRT
jgi:YbbR domain-containing protein